MIEKLTSKQEKLMAVYRDRYIAKGLNTDKIDKKELQKDLKAFYTEVLEWPNLKTIVLCKSPWELWLNVKLWYETMKLIEDKKIPKKKTFKTNPFEKEFSIQSYKKTFKHIGGELKKIGIELTEGIKIWIMKKVNSIKTGYVYPFLYGNFNVSYFALYTYVRDVLKVEYDNNNLYNLYEKLCDYSYMYPFEDICFCCEKPKEIHRVDDKLHAEDRPAVLYSDGFCLYMLNGIEVDEWIIKTKPKDFKIKDVFAIENIEVRNEAIKKMGEYFYEKLDSKVLDEDTIYIDNNNKVYLEPKKGLRAINYKLLEADIGLKSKEKILQMDNASIDGKKHFEIVGKECNTIMNAFNFRNGYAAYPAYLS